MPNLPLTAALAAGLVALASPAQATVYIFTADLSGLQEVPPNASPGGGSTVVTLDDAAFTLRVEASFSGLLGTVTAAHIHCCTPAGTNTGVATQTPTFSGFPSGVSSGTYDNTFDMTLASSWNAPFITAHGGTPLSAFADFKDGLLAEEAYLNIHSNLFPGGEIRGQLAVVPEPATWALLLAGFAAVGGAMRRRRVAVAFG